MHGVRTLLRTKILCCMITVLYRYMLYDALGPKSLYLQRYGTPMQEKSLKHKLLDN